MTPGPAPLRPVRVASRRASRADRTRQDSQSSVRTVLVRTSREVLLPPCPSVPPSQAGSEQHAERQASGTSAAGRWGPATRARGRDQGNRMVTSRDGVPRQPGRGRTDGRTSVARPVARRRGPRPRANTMASAARARQSSRYSDALGGRWPGRALPLHCVPLAGGAGVPCSGVTKTSRGHGPVGHGGILPSLHARPPSNELG